ncbi:MAG TPA: dienelactone hydrolase family protein [Rhizomicrobium sp.]|nr:dienelactone hydrolase family protein [Rhizomicrobium sp.]
MSGWLKMDMEYSFGGLRMNGYFAIVSDGQSPRPGILIVPDAFGLDSHCMEIADRLAENGFAAFALDLWGDRRQFENVEEVMRCITGLLNDREMWMGRVEAARRSLVAQPGVDPTRIAAIGYCLGGSTVLEFARFGNDINGVVSFHGGLDFVGADWNSDRVKARLLVCTGVEDPLVPWSALTAFQTNLRQGGVNWELDIYGGAKHSFTRPDAATRSSPDRSGYDPQADRRSWRAMMGFLEEIFESR